MCRDPHWLFFTLCHHIYVLTHHGVPYADHHGVLVLCAGEVGGEGQPLPLAGPAAHAEHLRRQVLVPVPICYHRYRYRQSYIFLEHLKVLLKRIAGYLVHLERKQQ